MGFLHKNYPHHPPLRFKPLSRGCQCQVAFLFGVAKGEKRTYRIFGWRTLPKTNMTMEKQALQDVSPIRNGDFRLHHVTLLQDKLVSERNFPPSVVVGS